MVNPPTLTRKGNTVNHNTNPRDVVRVIDPTADPAPTPDIVIRSSRENDCLTMCVIIDPADRQQVLYGTVTRPDGTLIGTYYPADIVRGDDWRVVSPTGIQYAVASEYEAVDTLTTTFRDRS
ncbi:hypothetical protein [Amycolatopsis sp. H20-H5]|uniref:hypothetical protein n=1 Tax=Amycolatopsis sp. H20-H5 TaxID=3046309 RepID=UPI002DBE6DAC|nr:hypothetical protein [Amycolatopsis sp. H20-H5]MEC3978877.1 hypothetical protein [Amycolatopsis sp. H20-H5]